MVHISAYPEESITINFIAPAVVELKPTNVTIVNGYPTATFSITAIQSSTFKLTYTISGPNAAEFEEPQSFYVLAIEPSTTSPPNRYFTQLGLEVGLLAPGCCTPGGIIYHCPFSTSTVSFSSTCMWSLESNGDHLTDAIVFTSGSSLNLPVSIAGTDLSVSSDIVQNTLPNGHLVCNDCGGVNPICYHYNFTTNDVVDLLRSQALAKTYLDHSEFLLPTWLNFNIDNGTLPLGTSFSSSDYSTTLATGDRVRFIQGCEGLQVDQNGLYSVLRYHNNITVLSSSLESKYTPSVHDAPICFAVDLCSGSSSSVHITIPTSSQETLSSFDQIQQYTSKGWEFTFAEALVSRMGVPPPVAIPTQYWNGTRRVTVSIPNFDLRLETTLRNRLISEELWISFDLDGDLFHQANPTGSQVSFREINYCL